MPTFRDRARAAAIVAACAVALLAGSADAKKKAKPDAALTCVSTKQKAAGAYCAAVLNAWSRFEKTLDVAKRDAAIDRAGQKLASAWQKAESKAADAGV